MHRCYSAVVAAVLLLFPVCSLVPSLPTVAQSVLRETTTGPLNTAVDDTERRDVELDMMHFSPSASSEGGIYYVARRGVDTIAYFGESEVYYVVGDTLLCFDLLDSVGVIPIGEEPTGSVTSYMYGSDAGLWRTGLKNYAVLRYANIYPGIDLVYRFLDGGLKYEFVVAPQADPAAIRLSYPDADTVDVNDDRVTVSKDGFRIDDTGLQAYENDEDIRTVDCAFRYYGQDIMGFYIGEYDTSCELVIDPTVTLVYSTFLGGALLDASYDIAVEDGCVYLTGMTNSSDFPNVNAYDSTHNGGWYDCFVVKFASDGQSLIYSTFVGGWSEDRGRCIAAEDGYAYVMGYTYSSDFPTVNAYDSSYNGAKDCFVTKFAVDGQSLVYSTFIGERLEDVPCDIAVESRSVYVTGYTSSSEFPTANAYDSTHNGFTDCFVAKFAANGQSFVYSTFLGGTQLDYAYSIAVESGCAYVTGTTMSSEFPTANAYDSTLNGTWDGFVTKFAADGQSLAYSTYLGGAQSEDSFGIALESGYAYVTGWTGSSDFPTVNAYDSSLRGTRDCFVVKLNPDGLSLVYGTYLGGSNGEAGRSIALESGLAFIMGDTYSNDFPVSQAFDSSYNGVVGLYPDCFVTAFTGDGHCLVYSTYLGGQARNYASAIAVESGCAYVTGYTESSNFPTVNAYDPTLSGEYDGFVAVLSFDTDYDGLSDWEEVRYGTNPLLIDTDNDDFLDWYEVAYGSDPLDPMSYPPIPQAWYEVIYEDLDGNSTLVKNLIDWSDGNASLLETVMQQLDANTTLLEQVILWLDGNHTAIETLFRYVNGNATLLMQTVTELNGNATQLDLVAALATQNSARLAQLNASHIGDIAQIRATLNKLGVTIGDTDYDGLDDLEEIALGTDIQCIDTDCDNLNDAYEVKIGTDPLDDDSDDDTYLDGAEVLAGSNPLDSLSYPGSATTDVRLIAAVVVVACIALTIVIFMMRRRKG